MEIKYEIADDKVRNFTDSAKTRLQKQSQQYTLEIIGEAEKIEELIRENGASTEITDNIIFQAIRRNKTEKKKMNCTPFVRQYAILSNKWGVYYAKRSTKQKVYARI